MIKAVIFDLDDTLCNTSEVLVNALKRTFEENLSHFPNKTVEEMLEVNKKAFSETFLNPSIPVSSSTLLIWFRTFELLGITPPIKPLLYIIEDIRSEIRSRIKLTNGADEVFEYLKSKKIKIGILSNGAFMEQAHKVILLGIDTKIDYLVTPDICLANKPHTTAFTYILNKLGVKASEAYMVGDSLALDIKGAGKVGIKGYLYLNTIEQKKKEVHNSTLTISNLLEIKRLL